MPEEEWQWLVKMDLPEQSRRHRGLARICAHPYRCKITQVPHLAVRDAGGSARNSWLESPAGAIQFQAPALNLPFGSQARLGKTPPSSLDLTYSELPR